MELNFFLKDLNSIRSGLTIVPDFIKYDRLTSETPDFKIKEIHSFLQIYHRIGNITTFPTEDQLRKFIASDDSHLLYLTYKEQIIAFIILTIFNISYSNQITFKSSYTTYLALNSKFHKKGYARRIINTLINQVLSDDLKTGYFLSQINHPTFTNFTRGENRNFIHSWYRPLNLEKLKRAKFAFKSFEKIDQSANGIQTRLAYKTGKKLGLILEPNEENFQSTYNLIKKWILFFSTSLSPPSNLSLYFNPDYDQWISFFKWFKIYRYQDEIFIFSQNKILSQNVELEAGYLVLYFGQGENLNIIINTAASCNFDLLCGYQIKPLNSQSLEKNHCLISTADNYLGCFNINLDPNLVGNIFLPFF